MNNKKSLIEAALFVSEEPLPLDKISKISGISSKKILKQFLEEMQNQYQTDLRGIELISSPDGYHFRVKEHLLEKVSHLTPHSDLTGGMLRTLGLIALKQPMMQSDVIKVQGNKAYGYIKKLEKKSLVVAEKFEKTKVLKTTPEFEKYFGKSLKEIQDSLKSKLDDNKQSRADIFNK